MLDIDDVMGGRKTRSNCYYLLIYQGINLEPNIGASERFVHGEQRNPPSNKANII